MIGIVMEHLVTFCRAYVFACGLECSRMDRVAGEGEVLQSLKLARDLF